MLDLFHGFNWDAGNKSKCQKHGVSVEEVEELFSSEELRIEPDLRNSKAEERFNAIGKTTKGRSIFLVFTIRNHESEILIRPISARYMHKKEIDFYAQKISNV
jgi:uncharacterized DUF497 family protein